MAITGEQGQQILTDAASTGARYAAVITNTGIEPVDAVLVLHVGIFSGSDPVRNITITNLTNGSFFELGGVPDNAIIRIRTRTQSVRIGTEGGDTPPDYAITGEVQDFYPFFNGEWPVFVIGENRFIASNSPDDPLKSYVVITVNYADESPVPIETPRVILGTVFGNSLSRFGSSMSTPFRAQPPETPPEPEEPVIPPEPPAPPYVPPVTPPEPPTPPTPPTPARRCITLPDRPELREDRMSLVLNDDVFEFPEESWLTSMPFKVRYKGVARALSHGMVNTGDRKLDGRDITITVLVDEKTTEDYFYKIDELKQKFYRKKQRLYVTPHRYITLDTLQSFEDKMEKGFKYRRATITAAFKCTDPFFYSDEISDTGILTMSPSNDIVRITNNGTAPAMPIIDVWAPSSIVQFGYKNLMSGRSFRYLDPRLTNGKIVVINSEDATVKFGDYNNTLHGQHMTNSVNNYHGSFLLLEPGENELQLVNTTAFVYFRLQYYKRYL